MAADIVAFGEKLDSRSIRITKRQQPGNAGSRFVTLLARNSLLGKHLAQAREVGARADLERQAATACGLTLLQLDRKLADSGSQERPALFAQGQDQPVHLRVVRESLF